MSQSNRFQLFNSRNPSSVKAGSSITVEMLEVGAIKPLEQLIEKVEKLLAIRNSAENIEARNILDTTKDKIKSIFKDAKLMAKEENNLIQTEQPSTKFTV